MTTSENVPLTEHRRSSNSVVPTSTSGASKPELTVEALLESPSKEDQSEGVTFLRKLWALLVLQYGTVLFIAATFTLHDAFHGFAEDFHLALEIVAYVGIIFSLVLAIFKGTMFPYTQIAFVVLTCSVGLELGLTFAGASWGTYGLIAVGQAITSFAVILALLQWNLEWLYYVEVAIICLFLSGLWILVLRETGASWAASAGVGLGGWGFTMLVLVCCYYVCKHVSPEEYVLAVLFILVPEALLCMAKKERHPEDVEEGDEEAKYGAT